jgi:cell division septation protein DedD
MDAAIPSGGASASPAKARRFSRSPVLFASIQLGQDSRGFILNASEGGLCVQASKGIVDEGPLDLRFQSVQPGSWVEARGRIVWRNEPQNVAGIEFIEPTTAAVEEVRKWLSFGDSLQELRANWWIDPADPKIRDVPAADNSAARAETLPSSQPNRAASRHLAPQPAFSQSRAPGESRSPIFLVALLGLVVVGAVAMVAKWQTVRAGYLHRVAPKKEVPFDALLPPPSVQPPPQNQPAAAPTLQRSALPDSSPAPPKNAAAPGSAPRLTPLAAQAAVLQVAAMSNEQNARMLVASLRLKHFPAFVSKRDGDRFYRVLVGPAGPESLRQIKSTLAEEGIPSIERPGPP